MLKIWIENNNAVIVGSGKSQTKYYLVPEPFCKRCCLPISLGSQADLCYFCNSHEDLEHFDSARAMGLYFKHNYSGNLEYIERHDDDKLTDHILKLKSISSYAKLLGEAMAHVLEKKFKYMLDVDCIIPVPQHPNSLKERGYNQAEELARVISDHTKIPLISDVLIKVKDVSMKGKKRSDRKSEITDAYKVIKNFTGRSILLIDDTLTTGFTADECAKVLKLAGADRVYVFVAGRDAPEYDAEDLEFELVF